MTDLTHNAKTTIDIARNGSSPAAAASPALWRTGRHLATVGCLLLFLSACHLPARQAGSTAGALEEEELSQLDRYVAHGSGSAQGRASSIPAWEAELESWIDGRLARQDGADPTSRGDASPDRGCSETEPLDCDSVTTLYGWAAGYQTNL